MMPFFSITIPPIGFILKSRNGGTRNNAIMKQHGFTLGELMVTIAVAGILLTVAIPGFSYLIMNNRMTNHVNQFVGDINLARSMAIMRKRNATICISTSYASTSPACTGGTDWTNGWIVWIDENSNNAPDAGEIIKIKEPLSSSTTFTSTTVSNFVYDARGFLNQNDDLTICDNRTAETGRKIVISNTGRTSLEHLACS